MALGKVLLQGRFSLLSPFSLSSPLPLTTSPSPLPSPFSHFSLSHKPAYARAHTCRQKEKQTGRARGRATAPDIHTVIVSCSSPSAHLYPWMERDAGYLHEALASRSRPRPEPGHCLGAWLGRAPRTQREGGTIGRGGRQRRKLCSTPSRKLRSRCLPEGVGMGEGRLHRERRDGREASWAPLALLSSLFFLLYVLLHLFFLSFFHCRS